MLPDVPQQLQVGYFPDLRFTAIITLLKVLAFEWDVLELYRICPIKPYIFQRTL